MTPDLEALARRAVACPRWRWMGGMFWLADGRCPECHGAGGFRWLAADGSESAEQCPCAGRLPHYPGFVVGHDMSGAIPDLTDPATLGCLLALVREAYGSPALYCRLSSTTRKSDGIQAWEVIGWLDPDHSPNGRGGSFRGWGYSSEAEALVATLEAAP